VRKRRIIEYLEALIVEQAGQSETLARILAHLGAGGRVPAEVPPILLAALAVPSRDGDRLPLSVSGREFLVIVGPGSASPGEVWEAAAGLVVAAGTVPGTFEHRNKVTHVGYRKFPDRLHAVAVPGSAGGLLAWVSVDLPPAGQRIAVRRLIRAGPAPGYRHVVPLAAPLPLLLRPTIAGAALAAAGTAITLSVLPGSHTPGHPHSHVPVTPAVAAPTRAPAPPPVLPRHHRRRDRDNSRAGLLR
jgi:hypothetical protein